MSVRLSKFCENSKFPKKKYLSKQKEVFLFLLKTTSYTDHWRVMDGLMDGHGYCRGGEQSTRYLGDYVNSKCFTRVYADVWLDGWMFAYCTRTLSK